MPTTKNQTHGATLPFTINFLDGHEPIFVEDRPVIHHPKEGGFGGYDTTDLSVGWGDRASDLQTGDIRRARLIAMIPPKVYADRLAAVPAEEIARVQALVDTVWRETATVAEACESYRVILQGIHDSSVRADRLYAQQPSTVESIRRNLGRKRVVSANVAASIIREIAPDEDEETINKIVNSCKQTDSITLWSPAGGSMRYDQPGTMSHRPIIVFAPRRKLSMPMLAPRALVLRIAA